MRSYIKVFILSAFVFSSPAMAISPMPNSGATAHFDSCDLGAQALSGIIDPYANLLPSGLDTASFELSSSYKIDLKPFRADDMSQYQTMIRDTRAQGAGYSSPYLWEAGNAPGSNLNNNRWLHPNTSGRSYYPVPVRR